jgi:hypothetical protein
MGPRLYRITVDGVLGDRWAKAFDGLVLEHEQGRTVLVGMCRDSSALYGVLDRIKDLGLDLLAIESSPSAQPPGGSDDRIHPAAEL